MFLQELAKKLGKEISERIWISGFAADSRKVEPGFAFFALKGEKVDGHDFLFQVQKQGACCAIVSKEYTGLVPGLLLIPVEDVLTSLQHLGASELKRKNVPCIAITGSVGKTTTKEFIVTLLSGSFSVGKTPGNANSQVGLPLSILNEREGIEVFVAEMGMSRKGEIASLVSIAPPDFAIVTQVALAHACNFPGGETEVAEAKAEILSHISTKKAFLHAQVKSFPAFSKNFACDCIFYAEETGHALVQEGEQWKMRLYSEWSPSFTLPFTAKHLRENFLGAALIAKELGVSLEEIAQRAERLSTHSMRFEVSQRRGITYVNDAYNASPASMKAALENVPVPKGGGKVIAVLGEMRELGSFSEKAHEEVGYLASKHAEVLLCQGKECEVMAKSFELSGKKAFHLPTTCEMKKVLENLVQEGDVVLVKASNSLKLWTILE